MIGNRSACWEADDPFPSGRNKLLAMTSYRRVRAAVIRGMTPLWPSLLSGICFEKKRKNEKKQKNIMTLFLHNHQRAVRIS